MRKYVLVAIILISVEVFSQEIAPKIKGKVTFSIKDGTIECDLTISELPRISDYLIRLNAGMNIQNFINPDGNWLIGHEKAPLDAKSTGETNAYYFPDPTGKGKFLPKSFRIRYTGKYPVIADTTGVHPMRRDWKGNIAFNGYSLRTDGRQSAWYPVLYDIDRDFVHEGLRYEIDISCRDCSVLYINGNRPIRASQHTFRSEKPYELSLFSGSFDFAAYRDTYILNPSITAKEQEELAILINDYKKFHSQKLGLPFDQAVTMVECTPVSAKDGWLFVSYPTVFAIGWGNNGLASLFQPHMKQWYRSYMAHEMAHYYFGTLKIFNSGLGDMMSEGLAEFMAMKLTKELIGSKVYSAKLEEKMEELAEFRPVPFAQIIDRADYGDREVYVYDYAPVIMLAVDKEIGEKKMMDWLRAMISSPVPLTNYEFLTSTLAGAIKDQKKFDQIRAKYFEGTQTVANAMHTLKDFRNQN